MLTRESVYPAEFSLGLSFSRLVKRNWKLAVEFERHLTLWVSRNSQLENTSPFHPVFSNVLFSNVSRQYPFTSKINIRGSTYGFVIFEWRKGTGSVTRPSLSASITRWPGFKSRLIDSDYCALITKFWSTPLSVIQKRTKFSCTHKNWCTFEAESIVTPEKVSFSVKENGLSSLFRWS